MLCVCSCVCQQDHLSISLERRGQVLSACILAGRTLFAFANQSARAERNLLGSRRVYHLPRIGASPPQGVILLISCSAVAILIWRRRVQPEFGTVWVVL